MTIGKNVKKIGANAFSGDSKLKTISIKGAVKSVGKDAFKGINKKATITIKASKANYKKAVKAIQSSGVAKNLYHEIGFTDMADYMKLSENVQSQLNPRT